MDQEEIKRLRQEMENASPEDREKLYEQARRNEVEREIDKRFKIIFKKGHNLTPEDKVFLKARASYLTIAEKQEYAEELAEGALENGSELITKTRKELEAILKQFGIQDVSPKVYRTNKDLILAIEQLQAEQNG